MVGIAVDAQVIGIGDPQQNAVVERQDHPRQKKVFEVGAVLVKHSVALAADVFADHAVRRDFVLAVDVLHVGAHLSHIHRAIGVEREGHRLLDLWFAEHQFQRIALRQSHGFQKLLRRVEGNLGLRREVVGRRNREGLQTAESEKGENGGSGAADHGFLEWL